MWYVYMLRCADRSFYIGSTTDLSRRVREHNQGRGGAYTRGRLPVTLVYREVARDRSVAQRREAAMKRWTRARKRLQIQHGRRAA